MDGYGMLWHAFVEMIIPSHAASATMIVVIASMAKAVRLSGNIWEPQQYCQTSATNPSASHDRKSSEPPRWLSWPVPASFAPDQLVCISKFRTVKVHAKKWANFTVRIWSIQETCSSSWATSNYVPLTSTYFLCETSSWLGDHHGQVNQ